MQFPVELPILESTATPQRALERMQESGRSGVIYFVNGVAILVHAADVLKGIASGKKSIAKLSGRRVAPPIRRPSRESIARKIVPPRYALLSINESRTVASIDARTPGRMESLIEPPLDCYCKGPRQHGYKHASHGTFCKPDLQPIECFRK